MVTTEKIDRYTRIPSCVYFWGSKSSHERTKFLKTFAFKFKAFTYSHDDDDDHRNRDQNDAFTRVSSSELDLLRVCTRNKRNPDDE